MLWQDELHQSLGDMISCHPHICVMGVVHIDDSQTVNPFSCHIILVTLFDSIRLE